MKAYDVAFPHLGIYITHLQNSVYIGQFRIAFYGMIIALGMLAGMWMACMDAKRRGQSTDIYMDFALWAIVLSVLGARAYYVAFSWDYYGKNPWQILNFRGGGLAIYGGIITAFVFACLYTRAKKLDFMSFCDTGVLGLITGQILGRWGNFFNCEAFGGYTDGPLAMRIRMELANASAVSADLKEHVILENGVSYIQVHPTFLYESIWNLCVLIFLLHRRKNKAFEGEIALLYLFFYGLGRFFIESLRTDQLKIPGTSVPVSMAVSVLAMTASVVLSAGKRAAKNH